MLENFGFLGLYIVIALIFGASMILLPIHFYLLKVLSVDVYLPDYPPRLKALMYAIRMLQ